MAERQLNIAVVGSGIAGLSAAWLLSRTHRVTVFESLGSLGMDARSIDVDISGRDFRIDVPLRVFYQGYYPQLTALYDETDIYYEPVDYSSSFSRLDGATYFHYSNWVKGKISIPYIDPRNLAARPFRKLLQEVIRFFTREKRALKNESLSTVTLEEFLQGRNYSTQFANDFLFPALAGICTCKYDSVREYPADVVIDYFTRGLFFRGVRRVIGGTNEVVHRLTRDVERVFTGTHVKQVLQKSNSLEIILNDGVIRDFDHVVIATAANHARALLGEQHHREKEILAKFPYEKSRVVMHKDRALAPKDMSSWAPVNFLMRTGSDKPMATIWMNKVQQALRHEAPIFQSWNPLLEPQEDLLLAEATFERPVVTRESKGAIEELAHLHSKPQRRLWFSGSYAQYGIPLLEGAVVSSSQIGQALGIVPPWE